MKIALVFASLSALLSVVFGAFGAHALRNRLSPDQLLSWETGVRYQMFHALALLLLVLLADRGMNLKPSMIAFIIGTVLFSGSIYLLSLGIGPKALWGPVTPIGGLCLIAGWAWMVYTSLTSTL